MRTHDCRCSWHACPDRVECSEPVCTAHRCPSCIQRCPAVDHDRVPEPLDGAVCEHCGAPAGPVSDHEVVCSRECEMALRGLL